MNKIPLILPQSVRVAIKNVETHLNSKFRGTPVEKQWHIGPSAWLETGAVQRHVASYEITRQAEGTHTPSWFRPCVRQELGAKYFPLNTSMYIRERLVEVNCRYIHLIYTTRKLSGITSKFRIVAMFVNS